MSVAEGLIGTIRFHRLKRLVKNLPEIDQTVEHPSFEECMEYYLSRSKKDIPTSTPEEAVRVLNIARKKNISALAFAMLLLAISFSAGVTIAIGGIIGDTVGRIITGIMSLGGILAFAFWQIRTIFKATLATKDIVAGIPKTDPQYQHLNNRQSLCVLAILCISGLYLILTVLSCGICIGLMVQ